MNEPVRLSATHLEKPWGSPDTEPWHPNPNGLKIGEVWFSTAHSSPLLVKLLFTADRLSVQVHPGDAYARRNHDCNGKTEMWHVLQARPGAQVAVGLREAVSTEALRQAAKSGEIESLLNWIPARPGDTFFIPAGTIHAIGAGLTLCEVQQLSDITYRLYDYGSNRELHLDKAMDVADCGPCEGVVKPQPQGEGRDLLVQSCYFRTERIAVRGRRQSEPGSVKTLYVALQGEGTFAGQPFSAGDAWAVPAASPAFDITAADALFLTTAAPLSAPVS